MSNEIEDISDQQAEATLISTIIYHPKFVLRSENLKPKYFSDRFNQCLYWAVNDLVRHGITNIDATNLKSKLSSNAGVSKIVKSYNVNIQDYIDYAGAAARSTVDEYMMYVNRVITLAYKRDLFRTVNVIKAECKNDSADLATLDRVLNDNTTRLTEQYLLSNDVEQFGSHVDDMWASMIAEEDKGIPSKWSLFDDYFTYDPGELVVLTARLKRGKSAWMMNEAIDKLKNGIPTIYIDTEMNDQLFYKRMLANLSGVRMSTIKHRTWNNQESEALSSANEWIKKAPFIHRYMPEITEDEIYATIKVAQNKMGIQFVVFDYIKNNTSSSSEQYNILGQLTDFLKNRVAGELNLPVLAGAQLNRNNEIADSDKIARYASTIIKWDEKTPEEVQRDGFDCGNFKAQIVANRNGDMMSENESIDFKFVGDQMRIVQAKQHKAQNPFEQEEGQKDAS